MHLHLATGGTAVDRASAIRRERVNVKMACADPIVWPPGPRAVRRGHPGLVAVRRLASIVVLLTAAAAFPTAVGAGVTVAIVPSSSSVSPGSDFDIFLQATQAGSPFNAFDAIIGYDPAALTLVPLSPLSLQEGSLMTGACGNTFHRFREGTDRDTATLVLLCSDVSVPGPGQLYRIRFHASNTSQVTTIRLLPGLDFYNAGLSVTPVSSSDATVGIGEAVGVRVPGSPGAPLSVRAQPNPWRTVTTLAVETPASGMLDLMISDVTGRVVRQLKSGWSAAGRQEFAWDGRDDYGKSVPPGLYSARLRAPGGESRTTLVRLR